MTDDWYSEDWPTDANRTQTPTAPHLPANPDREYCGRCGTATDTLAVTAGGVDVALCGGCLTRLRRRGVDVWVDRG